MAQSLGRLIDDVSHYFLSIANAIEEALEGFGLRIVQVVCRVPLATVEAHSITLTFHVLLHLVKQVTQGLHSFDLEDVASFDVELVQERLNVIAGDIKKAGVPVGFAASSGFPVAYMLSVLYVNCSEKNSPSCFMNATWPA